ncbi:MAG: hypothetical protein ACI4L5_05410 [Negativibacillus sp.]
MGNLKNKESNICKKGPYLTPHKLRRMLRWAKKKQIPVKIKDSYANDNGDSKLDVWIGIIKDYEVGGIQEYLNMKWFDAKIYLDNGEVITASFDDMQDLALAKGDPKKVMSTYYYNDGPRCYFSIRFLRDDEIEKWRKGE